APASSLTPSPEPDWRHLAGSWAVKRRRLVTARRPEELGHELVEGGPAVGGGDVADEHRGAGVVGRELVRGLAQCTGVGADEHDNVHVRTTRTADTAANPTPRRSGDN